MKLILHFAIALSIFSSLGFAAPFKNDSIAVYLKSTITSGCYIQEYDISGTQIGSDLLPSGYTCDAGKIAQLDSSGSILVVPMVKNTDTKIVALNPNKDVADTTTITGVNWYSALVSGNDMWLIGNEVGYTTRGSSGAPATGNIAGFIDGNPPQSKSGQLVGTRLLFLNLDSLNQINPVVKTGTGSVTQVKEGSVQVLANRFYVHKSNNLYTYYGSTSSLNKYSFVNGAATLQYSITLSISIVSLTAMDVNGVTYVLISYSSGSTYTLVRYTDTGSTFNGQTTVMTTSVAEIRSVSASPKATCSDGFKDQDETDVDCGGAICTARCANAKSCSLSTDCTSSYCNPINECSTPSCDDGFTNQDETDVDCGGDTCSANCDTGKICMANKDCKSNKCVESICMISCEDGILNQDETDIDCGGAACSGCTLDKPCLLSRDCLSGYCANLQCTTPTCNDSVKNQDETDVDCGGATCSNRCNDGKSCSAGSDCSSGVCDPDQSKCNAPTCEDSVKNQDETDVDCGGSMCGKCADVKACDGNGDCLSGICDSGSCAVPTCEDSVMNGDETDVDCGGSQCIKCPDDKLCLNNTDCNSNFCNPDINLCRNATCLDTYQNQDETDIDCGGSNCSKCAVGKKCVMDSDCETNTCASNSCAEPIPAGQPIDTPVTVPFNAPVSSTPINRSLVSVGNVVEKLVGLIVVLLAIIM